MADDLIQAAQSGDIRAENQLFTELTARFINLTKSILWKRYPWIAKRMCEMDIEDVVQNALITIRGKYKQMTFESGFYSWANKVLDNVAKNYVQRMKRKTTKTDDWDSVPEPIEEPEDSDLYAKQLLEKIKMIVPKMDKICKKVLMIFCEGGERQDVLKAFPDMTISNIDTKIHRCRQRLKTMLKKQGYIHEMY